MKLDAKLAEALNQQINNELAASLNYLAMAAYFDSLSLPGFASWFRAQSQEENDHGMRIYDFVVKRGADVTIDGITAPRGAFNSPVAALESALAMETEVTKQIHALYEMAQDAKEFSAQSMLNWFLDEQVEEEDSFRTLIEQAQAAGDDRWNLLLLDKEVAARGGAEAEA